MKKLLAILLVIVLVLPTGVLVQAEEVETRPFYMATWGDVYKDEGLEYVYGMAYTWNNFDLLREGENHVQIFGKSDIKEAAAALKEEFDTYPEGARYVNYNLFGALLNALEAKCFVENEAQRSRNWIEEFCKEYKSIGGELDGFVFDIEHFSIYSHYIHSYFFVRDNDPYIYDWIVNHDTYKNVIRPMLVERGFKFYESVSRETPEIYSIHPQAGSQYAASRSIWDTVMKIYMNDIITWQCEPLWEYFPDAHVSDYQSCTKLGWEMIPGDGGGNNDGAGGMVNNAGNSNNDNFYNNRPNEVPFYKSETTKGVVYTSVRGYNEAVYENSPFAMFRYDINYAKSIYRSSNGNVSWYLVGHTYGGGKVGYNSVANTAFYIEEILHLGLTNPEVFIGYVLQQDAPNDDFDIWCLSKKIINETLKELTRVVGAADRKPIDVEARWNEDYVLSGMYAGGKNIWRITPDTTKVSLKDFKVEGASDLTFSVNGNTITFPQGKIIEDGEIPELGTCGYWIETPADVMPVMTRADNYFREYPAYLENFEAYEAGTEYAYKTALPADCWEAKKVGSGSGTVITDPADGNNKVLALKGGYNLTNVNLPANILGSDNYATNQAWEISVTLPADLAADAEVVLLKGVNKTKKAKDGGIKIAGGKVYYSNATEYVEMPDVTLTAGTKYTIVRDVDFTNKEAFTSDYYVYDAEGKLLGKAMDIPMAELVLPVHGIMFGCTGVTGEAVLVDNYKLYPTSVAADLSLFNASTGQRFSDVTAAKDGDVAYRLAWLNTTQKEKTYTVMAAYYSGDTLVSEKVVQEVKMGANCNSYITGIVENATEGQKVLVYLRDDNPAEGDGGSDNGIGAAGLDMKLMIIIAAVAVVVILAVVVIAVVASKKKKKAAAVEVTEETEAIAEPEAVQETEEAEETQENKEIDAE